MSDVTMLSAAGLVALYRSGKLSPVEATRAALERIDSRDTELNAFCVRGDETALSDARASEARYLRGEPRGLVDGVPTSIKDMSSVRGWPARYGSRAYADAGPDADDTPAVARLREHGAVFIGKTTTPEFGWKGVTDSPLTGITRNPWNPERTPGGSSGGAAVAAATGMGTLHQGGDGGGSIRMPAAFTGVFGIKPTYGRVPAYPYPSSASLTHQGPLTRTVADAALMLTVMAEPDARDWSALPYDRRDWRVGLDDGVRGLRIAWSPDLGYARVDPGVAAATASAVRAFEELGAHVEQRDPGLDSPREVFETIWCTLFARRVSLLPADRRNDIDPGLRAVVERGQALGATTFLDAWMARPALGERMNALFQICDLLVTPQMPLVAFEAGRDFPEGRGMSSWLDWTPFTYPFNMTQNPAATVPCGFVDGLPVALQVVGPRYREDLVLRAARAFEAAQPFAMPGDRSAQAT
jgi:aspartyl-tRNA(Asn)/glutamyl-tRNA(Gln) amidotransferase subunit A